jgi:hypothetical protein
VKARNCAWVQIDQFAKAKAVWTRGGVYSTHCPKSVITAQSLYYLDQFRWWKQCGGGALWDLPAKDADAVILLEQAWETEKQRGEAEK